MYRTIIQSQVIGDVALGQFRWRALLTDPFQQLKKDSLWVSKCVEYTYSLIVYAEGYENTSGLSVLIIVRN